MLGRRLPFLLVSAYFQVQTYVVNFRVRVPSNPFAAAKPCDFWVFQASKKVWIPKIHSERPRFSTHHYPEKEICNCARAREHNAVAQHRRKLVSSGTNGRCHRNQYVSNSPIDPKFYGSRHSECQMESCCRCLRCSLSYVFNSHGAGFVF